MNALRPLSLNQPFKRAVSVFIALVAARVAAEFGAGVVDGFLAVWNETR